MITREQAIAAGETRVELHYGTCKLTIGPRGGTTHTIEVWRTNGRCQTWKTRPEDFRLPIKYGFRGPFSYVTPENAKDFHFMPDCQPVVTDKSA